MRSHLICFLVCLLFAFPAQAWEGIVLSVQNSKTVTVEKMEVREMVNVILYGVETPEPARKGTWAAQPYSQEAKALAATLMPQGTKVIVEDMGVDERAHALTAILTLPDGRVVQEALLQAGLAWNRTGSSQWKTLQEKATASQSGLWKDEKPVAPWVWRGEK